MQHQNHTPSEREAGVISKIASQMALVGRAALSAVDALRHKADKELAILERVVQLGYLTEEHIAEVTGITKGLSEILDELCANHQLRRRKISGVTIYWIRLRGLHRVPEIMVPGFGLVDLTKNPSFAKGFCRMGISRPMTMRHLLACSELAVRLYLSTNGVVLGDRTARLVERLFNQGKTRKQRRKLAVASRGHKVDLVAVSPLGEITGYEVERSKHGEEGKKVCLQLVRSSHFKKVVYIAYSEALHEEVEQRFDWVEAKHPKLAPAVRKCVAVQCKGGRPPALSRIMPVGTYRVSSRMRGCQVSNGSGMGHAVRA
jgi:hypothetical protein